MRNSFARAVLELAAEYPELILLSGDIGNRMFDHFKENYPSRFYNCGISEQAMTGMAAGLAASGLRPVTYTITPFNTLRCLEQIRLDICYPSLPVIIVGTGSGLSYAELGPTHHSLEDIAVMRTLPNLHVVCPADAIEVRLAIRQAVDLAKPVYIRLGKKGEPVIHMKEPAFTIGRGISLQQGNQVVLLGIGNMVSSCRECANILEEQGISTGVVSLHTIKPLDEKLLTSLFTHYNFLVIVEEHGRIGGAGSAILEWGCDTGKDLRKLIRIGCPDRFLSGCGTQQEARRSIGLSPTAIAGTILQHLRQNDASDHH